VDDYEYIQTLPNPFAKNEFIMVQHVTRNVTPKDCETPQSDDNPLDHSLTAKDFILSQLRSKNYYHNFYHDLEMGTVDSFIADEKKSSQAFGNSGPAA